MAYKILRQLSPATATTQDYTSSGFGTPTFVMVKATLASADATATNHACLSVGIYDGTRTRCCSWTDEHNVASADTTRHASVTNVLEIHTAGETATPLVMATISLITDGVRLSFSTASAQVLVTVTIMNAVGSVYVGTASLGNSGVPTDITDPAFAPKLGWFVHSDLSGAGNSDAWQGSFGFATSTAQRCVSRQSTNSAGAQDPQQTIRNDAAAAKENSWKAVASDWDASGLTLTPDANANVDVYYAVLELPGSDVWVGSIDPPTGAATQEITDPAFTPGFWMELATLCQTYNTQEIDDDANSFAICEIDEDGADYTVCVAANDAADPMDTESWSDDRAPFLRNGAGGTSYTGSFSQYTANGCERTFSSAEATQRRWAGLAIEQASAAAPADLADFAVPPPRAHNIFRDCVTFLEP